jgi:hypothetical protein
MFERLTQLTEEKMPGKVVILSHDIAHRYIEQLTYISVNIVYSWKYYKGSGYCKSAVVQPRGYTSEKI